VEMADGGRGLEASVCARARRSVWDIVGLDMLGGGRVMEGWYGREDYKRVSIRLGYGGT
jgi:hypothetical protein